MRRPRASRFAWFVVACLVLAMPAGCGKGKRAQQQSQRDELTFEQLADTSGLSNGAPLIKSFDAYRMDNGVLRVKGTARLPDSTRLQVTIRRAGTRPSLAMAQVVVIEGTFDSPPILGERGPLPAGRYEFEIRALFTPEEQSPEVLRATDGGRALRGPGITRTRIGTAVLSLTEEMTR